MKTSRLLSALLLLEFLTVIIPVIILGKYFHFPGILRQSADVALPLFHQNQSIIVLSYYLFMISALLYLPISIKVQQVSDSLGIHSWAQPAVLTLGIATAIFQTIGFSRWLIAIPFLADSYQIESEKATTNMLYELMNRYAGATIGEHLGFIMMGLWTISVAMLVPNALTKWFGILCGSLLLLSTPEMFASEWASVFSNMNTVANSLWSVWILMLAFAFSRLSKPAPPIDSLTVR
jgi:hypothetical protein